MKTTIRTLHYKGQIITRTMVVDVGLITTTYTTPDGCEHTTLEQAEGYIDLLLEWRHALNQELLGRNDTAHDSILDGEAK